MKCCSGRSQSLALAFALFAVGCARPPDHTPLRDGRAAPLHDAMAVVTSAMIESVTSPPVASRTYSYASVAAYETLRHGSPRFRSFAGQIEHLDPVPAPPQGGDLLLPLASVHAFLKVAEALVFAPEPVAAHRAELHLRAREEGVPSAVIERSAAYGDAVAAHVLAWASGDNIKGARAAARLEVRQEPGRWTPTPPAYMDALEPNWATVRPFVLASASQLRPAPPVRFDLAVGSEFRRLVLEVYDATRSMTAEQREIASFWDCNPFALQSHGHVMSSVKKMSPGGHWMGITGIVLRDRGEDLLRSAEAYSRVAMATADGFISSWDEKYHSIRVRPVTVIQQEIDASWMPLLQTPPFPEYTSGHSVISSAAAEVLTDLFGENVSFDDDTEVPFGLPVRSFGSFHAAAAEAAISRLYGGIHYRDAIEVGLVQGRQVGRLVALLETDEPKLTGDRQVPPSLASTGASAPASN
jgi:hypothetical protein